MAAIFTVMPLVGSTARRSKSASWFCRDGTPIYTFALADEGGSEQHGDIDAAEWKWKMLPSLPHALRALSIAPDEWANRATRARHGELQGHTDVRETAARHCRSDVLDRARQGIERAFAATFSDSRACEALPAAVARSN
jgi:hypothetical protein